MIVIVRNAERFKNVHGILKTFYFSTGLIIILSKGTNILIILVRSNNSY